MDLSCIIPVYNNEKTVRELAETLNEILNEKYQFEIIFVNDCSKDRSLMEINSLAEDYKFVSCVNLSRNGGQNNALLHGFRHARGEKVMVMDADLQDNLLMVPQMIENLTSDFDSLFILRKGMYQSYSRMLTSFILKGCIQLIVGLPRAAGTFFITQKHIVTKVINMKCSFPYITIMIFSSSEQVVYLSSKRKSNFGKSAYNFKKRLIHAGKALICAFQCRFLHSPK